MKKITHSQFIPHRNPKMAWTILLTPLEVAWNNEISSRWFSFYFGIELTDVELQVPAIYKNHSFNQFEQRKGVILLFCVTVCTTMSMEKRKTTRELSEEVRHKIVAKHGQSQGYKSISRDLAVPVSTIHNVIRKFKAHGTVANLPGHGHKSKLDWRLNWWIVRMVEKAPPSTAKKIQTDL